MTLKRCAADREVKTSGLSGLAHDPQAAPSPILR